MGLIFKFKQFEVNQMDCAMKINTDGVLVAALACDLMARYVLDIGTGTGVIAMMLAQNYPDADVEAVEIDELAAHRASQNFANSSFNNQLKMYHADFVQHTPMNLMDLIISNPPFYTNSLQAPDLRKTIAKHADELFFDHLLQFASNNLSDHGVLQIIVPTSLAIEIKDNRLPNFNLFLQKEWHVSSFATEESHRVVLRVGKKQTSVDVEKFFIYDQPNQYSQAYKDLLKPYFLAF